MKTFPSQVPKRTGRALVAAAVAMALLVSCGERGKPEKPVDGETPDPLTGLTKTQEKEVLAKVGDRSITLGDYAETIRHMGKFERLRYQSKDRQKELLEQLIDLELLAQEAERRGLDKDPEVQLRLQQTLRDEMLEELRRSMPGPETLSEREVREYYDAHQSEFQEPERRRPLVIVVASRFLAEKVRGEAEKANGPAWGALAEKYSVDRRGLDEGVSEFAGDLGFVSAPGEKRGENPAVPEEVRAAVFQLKTLGDVLPEPVAVGNKFYVVRLGGVSAARTRTVQDADRTVRIELVRQKYLAREKEFEAELRKKYPIVIDEAALAAWQKARAAATEKTKLEKSPRAP